MELLFILLIFLALKTIRIVANVRNDREWHKGLFENDQSDVHQSNDPLLEAYISLGALMVRRDTNSYREKILYLNRYFSKNFPKTQYDFGRSFTESLKNPEQPKVITSWLRRKLPHREERIQVMYFLAGLANVDGSMNKREVELLKEMNIFLKLTDQDFESIVAMFRLKQERKKSSGCARPHKDSVQLACEIIGVPSSFTKKVLKKAYRKLVMLHHPDRFATEAPEQQEIAEQRFLEIQKAYEILEKR
jgi:DnaJ like chaperone protein